MGLVVSRLEAVEPRLVDITERCGVDFVHRAGSAEKDWIAEVNGSGVALFDCDADGDLDIYFVQCGEDLSRRHAGLNSSNRLYRNDGKWRFTDITSASGTGDPGWGSGACVGDVDGDGRLDLYVTNLGPNVLFLGRAGGHFERAEASGCADPAWSIGASFVDIDQDGHLDLYVANYLQFSTRPEKRRGSKTCTYKGVEIFCGPGGLQPAHDSLFLGRGDGSFRDVSEALGVRSVTPSFGMGTLAVDIDRRGALDLFVANDTEPNFAFVGGQGRLREAAVFLGLAYNDYGVEQAGMGLAAAFLDGTFTGDAGDPARESIFVTHFEDDTNTLYRPRGELWAEETWAAGLGTDSYRYLSWGTFFFDVDGDGDEDLYVANGHVAPQADRIRSSLGYRQRDQLFVNDGEGRFRDLAAALPEGETHKSSSRGAAFGDLDGDGDPDVVVSNIDAAPTILENLSGGRHLAIRLVSESKTQASSNRAAVGALVTLHIGDRRSRRRVRSGGSFASQSELVLRFGLGDHDRAELAHVLWPSGREEVFQLAPSLARKVLVEGQGQSPAKVGGEN